MAAGAGGGTTDIILNTRIDNSGLSSGVSQANQYINRIGAGGGLSAASTGVAGFKAQLRQATQEALRLQMAGESGSQAYRDQVKIIASLKDEMDALGRAQKAFDPGNKFAALGKVSSLAASSLGAMTGTLTLLGVSADTANESIAKLQSIQAIVSLLDTWGDSMDILKPFIANLFSANAATVTTTISTTNLTAAQTSSLLITNQSTIAQNDLMIAELARIAALDAQVVADAAAEEARLISIGTTSALVIEQQKLAIATAKAAAAARMQAAAQATQTVVTESTTLATRVLGFALKGLGIGLIVAAVVYLITQWDSLKKTFKDLLPSAEQTGSIFNTIKEVVTGVGDAVVSFLIAPFRLLINLFQGDLKGAINGLIKDLNVLGNYEEGAGIARQNQRDKQAKEDLEKLVKTNESKLKHAKELGDASIALERKIFNDRKKLNADNEEELAKLEDERISFENGLTKARNDKAKADAKTLVDKLKKIEDDKKLALKKALDEANVIRKNAYLSERELSERSVTDKYAPSIKLAEDTYGKYSEKTISIVEAMNIELGEISSKYLKVSEDNETALRNKNLDEFEKRILDVYAKYDTLIKNDPANTDTFRTQQTTEVTSIRKEQTTTKITKNIDAGLEDPNLSIADKEALQLLKTQESYDAGLINLQAYQNEKTKIEKEATAARLELNKKESEGKQAIQSAELEALGQFGSLLEGIAGKNKALAIAGVIAQQGASIGKIIMATNEANAKAVAASPLTAGAPWTAINTVSGALGIASSLVAGRNAIASINSGTASSATSLPSSSTNYNQAPVINSNSTDSSNSIQKVELTNAPIIKAIVVDKDIKNSRDKEALYDNISNV